ncbi:MAG: dTMP kinase [Chitinispirillales bacterium]|jgi:dTMP kinase|nr:dTMP kinase [Chitinispirillales bacterium]
MKHGHFFTFEGIDGCGKSTQLIRVAKALKAEGMNCLVTREPGGAVISEKIREILISPENAGMCSETELLLYLAARAQHVRTIIKPAVDDGKIVLCDRFEQATFAYQGHGRGLDLGLLRSVNNFATGGLSPDITFIFDIPVELSIARLAESGKGKDRIESESPQFFENVRKGYLEAAAANPEKIKLLDGSKELDKLTEEILGTIFNTFVNVIL